MFKNQKGFTLVELLIVVAIMSIVALAVCGFIMSGVRSYHEASNDINVQQEAQLAMNQITDVLIDMNGKLEYVCCKDSQEQTVCKEDELTFEPDDKLLWYQGEESGGQNYCFLWDKASENLYYAETDTTEHFPSVKEPENSGQWALLARRVTQFAVDLSQFEEKRVVQITMKFICGDREYTTSGNVTVRNRAVP